MRRRLFLIFLCPMILFSLQAAGSAISAYQNQELAVGKQKYKELLHHETISVLLEGGAAFDADNDTLFHTGAGILYLVDPNFGLGPLVSLDMSGDTLFFETCFGGRMILPFAETLPLRLFVDAAAGYLYRRDRNTGVDFSDFVFRMGGGLHYFPVSSFSFGPEYLFHITDSQMGRFYHTVSLTTAFHF